MDLIRIEAMTSAWHFGEAQAGEWLENEAISGTSAS
jgi:hypothetical protein